ncbi:MAG: hypothetical protein JXR96_05125 [Deltaproteobacteria bacterium]|nr:hypothetical protein [Deltaproteobacteria bacterium]
MRRFSAVAGLLACAWLLGACGGGGENGGDDNTEALAYMAMSEGKVWLYDVDLGTVILDGQVEVVGKDLEYRDGVEAYEVETRQNMLLIATRWYEIRPGGMFLLGELVTEQTQEVRRTFIEPVEVLRHPLEREDGYLVQSWTSSSAMEEGGEERHRFDVQGKEPLSVPAGDFECIHLLHTRTDKDSAVHGYDEFFVPQTGFAAFEYPQDTLWSLRPDS